MDSGRADDPNREIKLLARIIFDALQEDNPLAFMSFGEDRYRSTIDGQFAMRRVARFVLRDLDKLGGTSK